MNLVFLFILSLCRPQAHAAIDPAVLAHDLPHDQCQTHCSAAQQVIWDKFTSSRGLDSGSIGKVFSGSCYHRSANLNPSQEHFGVIFLESVGGKIYMSGRFGFYYAANPYASWTPADAVHQLAPEHKDSEIVTLAADYAWVAENPQPPPLVEYYLRQNGAAIELFGTWGVEWNLFCDLHRN